VSNSPIVARNTTRGSTLAAEVAVAGTFWKSFVGLMGRSTVAPDEGLWMPGVTSIHMFFMRFAIDCAFLGPEAPEGWRSVLAVRHRLPPWIGLVWTVRGAGGVLELAPGALQRSGTQVGDRIILEDPAHH